MGGVPSAQREPGPAGPILAVVGAGVFLVASFVPLFPESRRLLLPEGTPFQFWIWPFLPLLALIVVVGMGGILELTHRRSPVLAGLLLGASLLGLLWFGDFVAHMIAGPGFGAGGVVGLVAAGLSAGGAVAIAGGVGPGGPGARPTGPILALAGVALVLVAAIAPAAGGLGIAEAGAVFLYAGRSIVMVGVVLVGAGASVWALAARAGRLAGGVMVGVGIMGGIMFLSIFGSAPEFVGLFVAPLIGMAGAALLIVGGAIAASQPTAPPGTMPAGSPASPSVPPPPPAAPSAS